ncbi:maleylacetate reductase [Saccharomonospora azurea]|uniref:Alcohol dehydrogenase, class IV n=1 Tax=Saccharomonospora azurea NA-128 TaxID=882081 RepID=H8G432_9PSEU|nr:maleylacetate reductase [Saccharomonospora azurea]EHY91130.1 alcohol dehydrogenase, class IV [Saccharomonospora azurea NA-128]
MNTPAVKSDNTGLVFDHETLPQRVRFGAGRAADNLADEVRRLGAKAVMVIAAPTESDLAQAICADVDVAVRFDDVAPHVPVDKAVRAREVAAEHRIDLLVSVGGGSTTGLAKAVALTTGIPIVAVPTTYAGSEATNVWGMTEAARKTTGVDSRVLPTTVIYDATCMLTLPADLAVASGLNALAHGVDSMWAPRADPINRALAAEAIGALADGMRAITADSTDLAGHEQTLYGAYLSAVAFASAGSGMHHKICHVLGGAYDLPHAHTHAIVLPHVLAFNADAAPEAAGRIAAALGADDAVHGLEALRRDVHAPTALREIGLDESRLDEAVELIMPVIPPSNPRPVTEQTLSLLLRNAWSGAEAERTRM